MFFVLCIDISDTIGLKESAQRKVIRILQWEKVFNNEAYIFCIPVQVHSHLPREMIIVIQSRIALDIQHIENILLCQHQQINFYVYYTLLWTSPDGYISKMDLYKYTILVREFEIGILHGLCMITSMVVTKNICTGTVNIRIL